MSLAQQTIFKSTDPTSCRLVRFSEPFPNWFNPFWHDNVVMRAAGIPGDVLHSKSYMARELLLGGIARGLITPTTTIISASSGNTGQGLGFFCNALGLKARIIMKSDTVLEKINAIRVIGNNVETILHSDAHESTVERARREGKEDGFYDTDQYANPCNPEAHRKYLGLQLFRRAKKIGLDISLLSVASGTM